MKRDRLRPIWAMPVLLLALGLSSGCATVHEVVVDAIRDHSAPSGGSYRLIVASPTPEPIQESIRQAVVRGLAGAGYYEALPPVLPELVVTVEVGIGPDRRKFIYEATVEPQYRVTRKDRKLVVVRDKYLRISARRPAHHSEPGNEVFSVHLAVEDEGKEFEPYLQTLAIALAEHINDHSQGELVVKVKPLTPAPRAVGKN